MRADRRSKRYLAAALASRRVGNPFQIGDRVQLATDLRTHSLVPVGTVVEFVNCFLADGTVLRDVLVRWDTGLEVPAAPDRLVLADVGEPSRNTNRNDGSA